MMLFQDYFRCYFRTGGGKAARGSKEALLLIFVIWGCSFGCRWVGVGGVGQRVSFAFLCLVLLRGMGARGRSGVSACRFGVGRDGWGEWTL